MLKYLKLAVTCFLWMVLTLRPALADSVSFLFWYPGAEGSAEQAAPVLEAWSQYLVEQGLPVTLTPVYSNLPIDQDPKLKKIKPAAAILSLEAYLSLSQQHSLTLLAQTRKQPSGDGSDSYTVLKNKSDTAIEKVYLSEPLTEQFTRNILLRNAPNYRQLPLEYASQVIQKLKQVGQGKSNNAVLVNAYEAAVLKQMTAPWAQNLTVAVSSPQLPAPPVVVFNDW